jgi:hypothetical protein
MVKPKKPYPTDVKRVDCLSDPSAFIRSRSPRPGSFGSGVESSTPGTGLVEKDDGHVVVVLLSRVVGGVGVEPPGMPR